MNDELQRTYSLTLKRIVLGLGLVGLALIGLGLSSAGNGSAWFIRAIVLLLIVMITLGLHLWGQERKAAYTLVSGLIILATELLFQPEIASGMGVFMLVLIVVITSLLLDQLATWVVGVFSVGLVAMILIYWHGYTPATALAQLTPFGLIILLTTFLLAETKQRVASLDKRLFESRELLKTRTLDLMRVGQRAQQLREEMGDLEEQLIQTQTRAVEFSQAASQKNSQLHQLFVRTLHEVEGDTRRLSQDIEQIEPKKTSPQQSSLIESAWEKLHQLRALAINLEAIIQIEQDELELQYETVDIKRLISEVVGTAQGLARHTNLQIGHQLIETLPTIEADSTRLRQALLQVLNNAINYTDRGRIEVQAEVNMDQELVIVVSDTGIGLPREEEDLVFKTFGRSRRSEARLRAGAGLGLALSKRLVELHGGRMWVSSVLNVGSTFYLALPLQPAAAKKRNPALAPFALPQKPSKPAQRRARSRARTDLLHQLTGPNGNGHPSPVSPPPAGDDSAKHRAEPIRRFWTTYLHRFGSIILGLFLVILVMMGTLMLASQLAAQQAPSQASSIQPDQSGQPAQPAQSDQPDQPDQSDQPAQTNQIAAASSTPTTASTPDWPAPPTPASTRVESLANQPPLATPAPTVTLPPAATATAPPPTATPSPSPTATTPSPAPTVPTLEEDLVIPAAVEQPSPPPQLTFGVEQAGRQTIFNFKLDDQTLAPLGLETSLNSRISSAPNGALLTTQTQAGNRDIYRLEPGVPQPLRLTDSPGDDWQADWSPDGRRIAFSSGRSGNFEIYVMDANGENVTQLTRSRGFDEWPVWSPDGQKIAFVSDRAGNVDLYVMAAAGGPAQPLTRHPADDWPAAWSPDGRWLAFASLRDGDWNLYVVPAAGGEARRLTNAPGAERDPAWSPDGASIAFAHNGPGNWEIYTLPLPSNTPQEVDSKAWLRLTHTPQNERNPAWRR